MPDLTSFPSALPSPRTPEPMAAPVLRWGVLGSGWIAERFIGSLQRHTRQQILAVGSRATGRAGAFAARHGIPRGYGSYAELAADADVDIVYVATPHTEHLPCARLALEAGKPVLVEKPLGLNAAQAAEIARLAAARGLRGRGPPGRRAHHVVQRHPKLPRRSPARMPRCRWRLPSTSPASSCDPPGRSRASLWGASGCP